MKTALEYYNKKSNWYGAKLTRKTFDEIYEFVKRCTPNHGMANVNGVTYITWKNYDGREFKAELGDYVLRDVTGMSDYSGMVAVKPYYFKQSYSKPRNYGNLRWYDLTDTEYHVLRALFAYDSDCFYGYDWIMDYTEVDRKQTQTAAKHLRELNVITFLNGLMNDDGEVAGSGYGFYDTEQKLIAELLMWRKQSKNGFDPEGRIDG